jgi:hypothetical protein
MITADEDYRRHLESYSGFTSRLKWGTAMVVVVIVILAFITL